MTALDALTDPYVLTALAYACVIAWAVIAKMRGYRIF